jgi:hypothetical protein
MANKHISHYLKWYLSDSCQSPKFAVLLKGGWGSGKTYFIKQFIKEYEEFDHSLTDSNKKSFLYISLYGLSAANEIDDQIFQQLHPILASKGVAIAGKIAKGLLNFGLKINLDADGNTEASASSSIPDISIKSILSKFKNKFLVFDDLERCNMPIQNVLGYINAFVEHQDSKVIIIANDDEIEQGLDSKEKKSDSKYHRIKEKVIGKAFSVEADNFDVLRALIEECSQKAKLFLIAKHTLCFEIFNAVEKATGQRNFRAFSHSLRDFEYIWPTITEKYREHDELMTYFVNIFLRFSYELQLSNIIEGDILHIDSWRTSKVLAKTKGTTLQQDTPKKPDRLDGFFSRHSSIDAYNILIMPYALWYNLICKSSNVQSELNESFGKSQFFVDENTPEWQKLWHNMTLEDNEVPILIEAVSAKISSHEYQHPGVVLHVFGLFLWLNNLGYKLPTVIGSNARTILRTGKSYVDWLEANSKLPDDDKVFSAMDMRTGCFGLGFAGTETKEFQFFKDYYEQKTIASHRNTLISSSEQLLELMSKDPSSFYKSIGNPHFSGSPLWNIPIFSTIKPTVFLDSFLNAPNKNKGYVLDSIKERYKWLNSSDENLRMQMRELVKELPFWKQLGNAISRKLRKQEIRTSLLWLDKLQKDTIKNALKELNTFDKNLNQPSGNTVIVRRLKEKTESNSEEAAAKKRTGAEIQNKKNRRPPQRKS